MNPKKMYLLLVASFIVFAMIADSVAATESGKDNSWKFTFTPYLWASGLSGVSSVGPKDAAIDLSFGDVLSNLEMTAMGDFIVVKGRWAFQTNLAWVKMATDESTDSVRLHIEPTLSVVEFNGRYMVSRNWAVLAGIRYFDVGIDVDVRGDNFSTSVSSDENWVDPIVGAAWNYPLNEKWTFLGRGDIGGFGAGSDFAWNLQGFIRYQFNPTWSMVAGWRNLDWDYDSGSELKKFKMDTYMTGPVLGVSITF
jgi:hypothetical protein